MGRDVGNGKIIIIGAGIGGLAASLVLRARGHAVTVFERHNHPGGKIRARPSAAGPIDAGPTVFTLRAHFETLFEALGERLEDHLDLAAEPLLARHVWPDGSQLDLFSDRERSAEAIRAFGGQRAENEFRRFCVRASRILDAFEAPVMRAPRIKAQSVAVRLVSGGLATIGAMSPLRSMSKSLATEFSDPRLAQLFGRYSTYVGGAPERTPALLRLIWAVEERGVWRVRGGISELAVALHRLAEARGVVFRFGEEVKRMEKQGGRINGIVSEYGTRHRADAVVFNGDPAALCHGMLGPAARDAVAPSAIAPRSHSAAVWAFAARPVGVNLAHHTVFFGRDPSLEFGPISRGRLPEDPALYVCAQDRGTGMAPAKLERFEIIMNAPPVSPGGPSWSPEEKRQCHDRMLQLLSNRGLRFDPAPGLESMTTPMDFARDFPGSDGSLYGRSPHGMTASFRRPTARSRLPGLYLAGGGAHPGPGIPMALLSGMHAAEAIANDRISTSSSRRTAMPGGMSTASPTTATGQSRSSPS